MLIQAQKLIPAAGWCKVCVPVGMSKNGDENREIKGLVMEDNIRVASNGDYARLVGIWESAVRATHGFLAEEDFVYYKSHLTDYFAQVSLYVYEDVSGGIAGFMGVSGAMLEMLFVDVSYRGKGIGTA